MNKILLPTLLLTLLSCSHTKRTAGKLPMERAVNATLWLQNAGEAKALSHQAFNLARLRLDQDLKRKVPGEKRRAVVVDLDETVLDNSPYQARAVIIGEGYPKGWQEWIERGQAPAIPGAVEFLRYANSKGVSIFYITNRKDRGKAREGTIKNLKALGLPVVDERVMLRTKDRSKTHRRQQVLHDHHIVLLIGDNLGDFDDIFSKSSLQERNQTVEQMQEKFGQQFIVLPNPVYGDWESVLYRHQFDRPESELANLRRKALHHY